MISLVTIITIILFHYMGDFVFQSDYIAKNKSSSVKILGLHCLIYSLLFIFFGLKFAIINGILHFIVDFCTSKLTKYYWERNKTRLFFDVIGIDQLIHYIILFTTYKFI